MSQYWQNMADANQLEATLTKMSLSTKSYADGFINDSPSSATNFTTRSLNGLNNDSGLRYNHLISIRNDSIGESSNASTNEDFFDKTDPETDEDDYGEYGDTDFLSKNIIFIFYGIFIR